jgi:hypothetical protein
MTTFYCLRFETPTTWSASSPYLYPLAQLYSRTLGSLSVVSESESDSYVTTDSLSWNEAPIWGLRLDPYYCQTVAGLLMWGVLSLTRGRVNRLQVLLVLTSAVFLGS